MSTTITIGRRIPAMKSDDLRNDEGVYAAAQELTAFLETEDIDRVTFDDVAGYLSALHDDAQVDDPPTWYEEVWDPVQKKWVLICHDRGSVSFRDSANASPIEVTVDISAAY